MESHRSKFGFSDIDHTADLAIQVSAPDTRELFQYAVDGLYHHVGIIDGNCGESINKEIHLKEVDLETLLVSFLNEILFDLGSGSFYSRMDLHIQDCSLSGNMAGNKIDSISREIKSVTFSELNILINDDGYSVKIVFDV